MRHTSNAQTFLAPTQTALRPHPTRFIYLPLGGRAYSGLGWRTRCHGVANSSKGSVV